VNGLPIVFLNDVWANALQGDNELHSLLDNALRIPDVLELVQSFYCIVILI